MKENGNQSTDESVYAPSDSEEGAAAEGALLSDEDRPPSAPLQKTLFAALALLV